MSSPNYSQFVSRPMSLSDASLSRSNTMDYNGSIPGTKGRDHWPPANPTTNMNRPNMNHPQLSSSNHHHQQSPPPPPRASEPNHHYNGDRDTYLPRQPIPVHNQPIAASQSLTSSTSPRTTLWWGDLEPWMDEEYARQVCSMMNWDPVNIKVPRPPADSSSNQHPNNPGYCFLTFSTQNQAASVLNQINTSSSAVIMPNSTKPFVFNWASAVPTSPSSAPVLPIPVVVAPVAQPSQGTTQQFSKEYSIFVGDLAPEVSNSDLVAVFRNPVLGLRNDREPRFIRPFLSCKSAKIMLDPVTGISRGYGFVRFTDEPDQQRALIEMHGLYCLSRPMRISPATAKYKATGQPAEASPEYAMSSFPTASNTYSSPEQPQQISAPTIQTNQTHSIPGPFAPQMGASNSLYSGTSSSSIPSLSSGVSSSSSTLSSTLSQDNHKVQGVTDEAMLPQSYNSDSVNKSDPVANGNVVNSITSAFALQHNAHARAILSNLIGPNGEQLSSSDPYNTTVFVGGLSPLIAEDTLRTFFAPFGEIHYVKVPAGKNCGFVQFIRKPDAERAIEKMQGFPIGGSRIRLSWGRSQYKAAQAAAQAAQTAALQTQFPQPSLHVPAQPAPQPQQQRSPQTQPQTRPQSQSHSPPIQNLPPSITPEQALELVQKLGLTGYFNNPEPPTHSNSLNTKGNGFSPSNGMHNMNFRDEEPSSSPLEMFPNSYRPGSGSSAIDAQIMRSQMSNFSPFSPDPSMYLDETKARESISGMRHDQHSKAYVSGFGDHGGKISPANVGGARSHSGTGTPRYGGQFFDPGAPHLLAGMQRLGSPPNQNQRSPGREAEFEQESIHDLNGTLASLDLDSSHGTGAWRQLLNNSTPSS